MEVYTILGNVHNFREIYTILGKCTHFFEIYTIFGSVHNFWEMYIIFGNVYNFWKCTQFFRNVHNFWICTYSLFGKCTEFSNFFLFRLQKFHFKSQRSELSASATKGSTHPTGQLTQLIFKITTLSQCQVKKKNMYHRFFLMQHSSSSAKWVSQK